MYKCLEGGYQQEGGGGLFVEVPSNRTRGTRLIAEPRKLYLHMRIVEQLRLEGTFVSETV